MTKKIPTEKILKTTAATLIIFAASIAFSYFLALKPNETIFLTLTLLCAAIIYKNQKLGLFSIIMLPVFGELIRIPIGPENGSLVSDFATIFLLAIFIIKKFNSNKTTDTELRNNKLFIPVVAFSVTATISLINALTILPFKEVLQGSLYLIRLIGYISLFFISNQIVKTEEEKDKTFNLVILSGQLLAIAGFIQLLVMPNMGKLAEEGWDPHIGRLVSTWLDPNFIGCFFAIILNLILAKFLFAKTKKEKIIWITLTILPAIALFFTYSRSTYLALAVGLFTIGVIKSRKLIAVLLLIAALGISSSERVQQRVGDMVTSIKSVVFTSNESPDPTAKLRIISWEQTNNIINKYPIFGIGYNTLKYIKYQEGYVESTNIHSASGSDSSLQTIQVTTGTIGLICFLSIYLTLFNTAIKTYLSKQNQQLKAISLGLIGATVSLSINSFFINSLLFPQIMISFWILYSLLDYKKHQKLSH